MGISQLDRASASLFDDALRQGTNKRFRIADFVFMAAVLLVAFFITIAGLRGAREPNAVLDEGPRAVIQNREGYYAVMPLAQDAEVEVLSTLGTNRIEVDDGRIRVESADCGNQVCVHTGWVSEPGQMIVCLPHELTIQVVITEADAIPLT